VNKPKAKVGKESPFSRKKDQKSERKRWIKDEERGK
jgi:hypothetical protein